MGQLVDVMEGAWEWIKRLEKCGRECRGGGNWRRLRIGGEGDK